MRKQHGHGGIAAAVLAAVALLLILAYAGIGGTLGDAAATPPVDPNGCANGETFNPFEDVCEPNSTHHDICHVAGLASDPANYIDLNIPIVAIIGQAGHFGENGTPNAGHEEDSYGTCNPPPPPPPVLVEVCDGETGEIIVVPEDEADQYLPVDDPACDEPEEPIEVEASVTFVDPTCDTEAGVVAVETEGVNYALVGAIGPGETVTVTATAEEGYELVGQTEWTHTFGEVPEDCDTPPPPCVECTPIPPNPDPPPKRERELPHTL